MYNTLITVSRFISKPSTV